MTRRVVTMIMLLGAAVACQRSEPPASERANGTPAAGAARSATEPELPNELQIAADMLRDIRMTTMRVESRTATESSSTLVGELQVNEERYGEVVAPVAGRVSRVLADIGEQVRAGQPLAELQSTELGRARAAYTSAQARLDLARRALARKRTLADERIAPVREVQEAQADADAAEADARAARAELQALGIDAAGVAADESDASRLLLRAPVSGVVIDRALVVGRTATPDVPLFRVADLSRLWLVVHAFERDALRVSPGAPAVIAFAALPGQPFAGRVSLVGRQIDLGSRTVPIRIDVANPNGQLRPGMSAAVTLPLGGASSSILTVPVAALQRFGDEWVVFLAKPDGHFEIRPVGRGRDLGTEVEVVRGLAQGELVVVDGAFVLKAEAEKARGQGDAHEH